MSIQKTLDLIDGIKYAVEHGLTVTQDDILKLSKSASSPSKSILESRRRSRRRRSRRGKSRRRRRGRRHASGGDSGSEKSDASDEGESDGEDSTTGTKLDSSILESRRRKRHGRRRSKRRRRGKGRRHADGEAEIIGTKCEIHHEQNCQHPSCRDTGEIV